MFGDDPADGDSPEIIRICCGPRCGAESDHRRIYAAVEQAAKDERSFESAASLSVRPVMCQGFCGMGVTLVLPDGSKTKIRAPITAREMISMLGGYLECQPSRF
jgi:NADH:ubiquinone oxidoreductase subunit E